MPRRVMGAMPSPECVCVATFFSPDGARELRRRARRDGVDASRIASRIVSAVVEHKLAARKENRARAGASGDAGDTKILSAAVSDGIQLLHLSFLCGLFLHERDDFGARGEPLRPSPFVAGQNVDRQRIDSHQSQNGGERAAAQVCCILWGNQVPLFDLLFDSLAFESQHRYRHLVSVVTAMSIQCSVTVNSILWLKNQRRRECVTTRAEVQSEETAMNNPKHNRKHPRPPGLIRAGGLIHDPRRPLGQRPAAQREA